MDIAHHVWLREIEQLVVALQRHRVIGKALAAKRRLVQLALLDHGAHRTIEQHDALAQQSGQRLRTGVAQGVGWLPARRR